MKQFIVTWMLIGTVSSSFAQQFDFSKLSDQKEFDEQIEMILSRTEVPGVSLAIIENHEVVYAKGYGKKDLESGLNVNDSTLFQLCSLSKIYLLHAAMQLVDDGILNLDTPAYKVLPHVRLTHDNRYKSITPRMILNHTSGIENWQSHNDPEVLEIRSDPGKSFVYSGEGYNYIAEIIAELIGTPYEEYIREFVLQPLDLTSRTAYFTDSLSENQNYAIGHTISGKPLVKIRASQLLPSSTLLNDAASFARMTISLFSEDYLSPKSISYIQSKEVDLASMGSMKWYWGNGLAVSEDPTEKILHFGGSNSGFKSYIAYSPKTGKGFVYLTNADIGDVFAERLNSLVTKWDWLFKVGYYFEIYHVELFLLMRDIHQVRGERDFLDGLIIEKRAERGIVDRVSRNWIMVLLDSVFFLLGILIVLWSLLQLLPGTKFLRSRSDHLSFLLKNLLGVGGLIVLLVWIIMLLMTSSSELLGILRYSSVIKTMLITTIITQLFWFSAVRRLVLIRLLTAICLTVMVYFQSGLMLADLDIVRSRSYRPDNFESYYYFDYIIGLTTALILIVVAYIFLKPKRKHLQTTV